MKKVLRKLGKEGTYLNIIKTIYDINMYIYYTHIHIYISHTHTQKNIYIYI
jgi:hypothetical protein